MRFGRRKESGEGCRSRRIEQSVHEHIVNRGGPTGRGEPKIASHFCHARSGSQEQRWRRVQRSLRFLLMGVVLLVGAAELVRFGTKYNRKHHLTPEAEAIFQITGIRIYSQEPAEEAVFRNQLVVIANILKQSHFKQADLSAICLAKPPPWWTVSGLFNRTFSPQKVSSYFQGEITLPPTASAEDLCHELQHANLHRLPGYLRLRQEWISCNQKPYKAYPSFLRGGLIERRLSLAIPEHQAQQDGFWSDYARAGFEEDVAELVGTAVACPLVVMPLLTNNVIRRKIETAIKYELLSQAWLDFAPVAAAWRNRNWSDFPAIADAFLSKHPEGYFAVEVLHLKAKACLRREQQETARQI